jgi:hypothetical protein
MNKDIIFTKHANNMLVERGFKKDFIVRVVLKPDFKEPGDDDLWYALKKVGQKYLRVVVGGKKKPYIVISLYYDRRLRKKIEQMEVLE